MTEKALPEFNDEYVKKSQKDYKTFGGKIIHVLYGAKDENGNPVEPIADREDGHGEWYGMENNGEYTMFSWKKPQSEGGSIEYGTSHEDHALEDLKKDLETKKELCREAENSDVNNEVFVNELKQKWGSIENWNTVKEAELETRFESALNEIKEKATKADENKKTKEELIAKAQDVLKVENFKSAENQLNDLLDQYREVGTAGKENDVELKKQLNKIRRTLEDNKKEYFQNINAKRAEAKAKKEELIAKAKEAVENVKNYKTTGDQLNRLFDEWKESGRTTKEEDDALWEQFYGIRNAFQEQRRIYINQRNAEWETSINKKKELIEKAKEIADRKDYSKEATEEMKQLDRDYKAAGFSGLENNDKLWEEFTNAKEVFWNEKHKIAMEHFQTLLNKKEEQIHTIGKEIENLEFQVQIKPDLNSKYEIEDEIDRKSTLLNKLKEEVENLKAKIGE